MSCKYNSQRDESLTLDSQPSRYIAVENYFYVTCPRCLRSYRNYESLPNILVPASIPGVLRRTANARIFGKDAEAPLRIYQSYGLKESSSEELSSSTALSSKMSKAMMSNLRHCSGSLAATAALITVSNHSTVGRVGARKLDAYKAAFWCFSLAPYPVLAPSLNTPVLNMRS